MLVLKRRTISPVEGILLTHDVHSAHLRPNLGEHGSHGPIDHLGTEQVDVGDVLVLAFKLAHVADILQLDGDKGGIHIALGMDVGQNLLTFLPAIPLCEPTGGFGEEEDSDVQEQSGDHLETPGQSPGGRTVGFSANPDIGMLVGDEGGAI